MVRQRTHHISCHVLVTRIIVWLLLLLCAQEVHSSGIGYVLGTFVRDAVPALQHWTGSEGLAHSYGHQSLLRLRSGRSAPDVPSGLSERHTARLLSASSPMVVHQCFWDTESSSCAADDAVNVMYAVHSRPASAYLWFLLMTYDRETACGVHRTASACRGDMDNRCIYFDDVLTVIGGGLDPLHSNNSSGSNSSSSSSSNNNISSSSSGKRSAISNDPSSRGLNPTASFLSQRLQQHQQDLQELLHQQTASSNQQFLLLRQVSLNAAAKDSSSGDAGIGSTGAADYSRLATTAAPTSAQKPINSSTAAAPAAKRRTKARGATRRDVVCTSRDLLENYVFTKSAYSNPLQAPLAMHCPGSKAADLVKCMRLLGHAACASHPECVFVPGSAADQRPDLCVSSYFHSLTPQQVKKFTYDVAMAEPSAVGGCDGACWMRQAMLCNRTRNAADCRALSFCRASPRGTCTPRLYTGDNFGSSVQEYMGECEEVDNKRDCESLRLRLVNQGAYGHWHMPKAPTHKCSVPSIGRLLGPTVVQERGSRLITAAGAVEERAAERQAATAAAAAAANAAQLVSGRGPVVLRQIYFRDRDS